MLALGARYLNGFVAASAPDDRERPEWPPHPARVFMALAAAHFETGADPAERRALLWLESLPPPALRAPDALPRAVVTHYVPVNDKSGDRTRPPTASIQSIPQLARDRQPRTFARAWLEDDTLYLVWREGSADPEIAGALEGLCRKVTRVGHSMSLVQAWLAGPEEVGDVNWVPDDDRAEVYLRVPGPGTLEDLERRFNAGAVERCAALVRAAEDDRDGRAQREARRRLAEEFGNEPPLRLRPSVPREQGYARPARAAPAAPPGGVFSPHLVVFALEGRGGPFAALALRAVLHVVQRWREALVSQANDLPDAAREIISGHGRDGAPLESPHLAFVPMAFVGHPHADGHLVGLAAALPAALPAETRRHVLRALGRVQELRLGALGVWGLVRDTSARPPWTLRPETWTARPAGATHWATVTPIAFDRHPKAKGPAAYQREVAGVVSDACVAVGLPRPRQVVVTPVSAHLGVPPAFEFPRLRRKDGSERRHAHAIVVFDQPVVGPVLLGAGRYRGYGVCRAMDAEGDR
ncbi:MAG TPA: type I-U CRISPR-associated protein Csb2 [Vicinamibacterales bacterium]|nr:type I-U CRISPR-associated protein Csb2 [Vicinamibacterales bacterium]